MWNLINAPETEIFGIAIALMVLLGVLEVISTRVSRTVVVIPARRSVSTNIS